MIEVYAHNYLKNLLKKDALLWPHNLTLSRLVARSLRRRDKSNILLKTSDHNECWPGVLIPLCLNNSDVVLVLTSAQKRRLLQLEVPRLKQEGLDLALWEGNEPPINGQVWILNHMELVAAYRKDYLLFKQLIIPEADLFSRRLREAMSIKLLSANWDSLSRAYPCASSALVNLHERISRKLFSNATRPDAIVRIDSCDLIALKDLIGTLPQPPEPWNSLLNISSQDWVSWAALEHKFLDWSWHFQPLEPLITFRKVFKENPFITLGSSFSNELNCLHEIFNVNVTLGGPIKQEPIKLFVPFRQPLPNSECFAEHLLEQSRRLILGRQGLTIIILDDESLLRKLTAQLAAEFGKRVIYQSTAPETNGVICCCTSWWLSFSEKLPSAEQLVFALLPISSLESPLTAARVEAFKRQGLDWFRDLLLPELLVLMPKIVLPLRHNQGRIAILDGRLRSRAWGTKVFDILQPWIPLERLLPD